MARTKTRTPQDIIRLKAKVNYLAIQLLIAEADLLNVPMTHQQAVQYFPTLVRSIKKGITFKKPPEKKS